VRRRRGASSGSFCGAEATGESLALIAVARPSSAAASFAASLRHLLPPERVREIDLAPLGDAEALELVKKLAPRLRDDAARAVAARSGGSPFWDDLLELELDVQQAAVDMWSDGNRDAGRALAHETAGRAQRRFDVDESARRVYVEALRVECDAAYQEDDPQAMVLAAEQLAAVARSLGEQEHLTALLASARALRRMGRVAEALERSERVYRAARQRVFPRLTLDGGYRLATYLLQRGRVSDADDVVAATVELASRIGDEARNRHPVERLACEVDFYRREWRGGVDRLLAYARGASEHRRVDVHQLAARWIAFAGGPDLADEVLAQIAAARACSEAAGCPWASASTRCRRASTSEARSPRATPRAPRMSSRRVAERADQ
jgi:hypothetical protein